MSKRANDALRRKLGTMDVAEIHGLRLEEQAGRNRRAVIAVIDDVLAQRTKGEFLVIQIKRHLITGGIRRAPGQVLTMTPAQIRGQRLSKDDYTLIRRLPT